MRPPIVRLVSALALATVAACPAARDPIECVDNTSCGLAAGGLCSVNPATGHQFCAYPDDGCAGGLRWSDYDVEQPISGTCVDAPDAGVDGPPPVGWAIAASSSRDDFAYGVAFDPAGNTYVVGAFYGAAVIAGQAVNSNGSSDLFVAKLSPQGERLWVRTFGGTGTDEALDVAATATQVVIVGSFSNAVDFGTGLLTAPAGSTAGFTLSLDPTGATAWADHLAGTSGVSFRSVDASDTDVAVMGQFYGTITLPTGPATGRMGDLVALRYEATGTRAWAHVLGSTSFDNVGGVALDATGDVIVGLQFRESLDVGVGTPLTSAGNADIAVAKLARTSGAPTWARPYGGTGNESLAALDVAGGTIALAGSFLGATAIGTTTATSAGIDDAFVASLDASGAVGWVKTFGAAAEDAAYAVAATPTGVVAAGYFTDRVTVEGAILQSLGAKDVWLAEFSNTGVGLAAKRAGGGSSDWARALAVRDGWAVVAGDTRGAPDMFGIALPALDLFQDGFAVQVAR